MGKYKLENINCFNILSPVSAYWLGFLAADGYFMKVKDKDVGIGIGLNEKDVIHLENFRDYLKSDHPIKYHEKIKAVTIRIVNKNISKSIRKWLTNKTIKDNDGSLIKEIPDEFKSEFISGYFDGDGSVFSYVKSQRYKDKKYDTEYYALNIVGNYNTLSDINEYLLKNYDFNKLTLNKHGNIFKISWTSKNDIKEFYKLYSKSPLHLNRKVIKYEYVLDKIERKNKIMEKM